MPEQSTLLTVLAYWTAAASSAITIWLFILGVRSGWLMRRTVRPVRIHARKVRDTTRPYVAPEIIVATFSGLKRRKEQPTDEFNRILSECDYGAVGLCEATGGIGSTIHIIKSYPSLKRLYLICSTSGSKSDPGPSSKDAVPLLRRYVSEELHSDVEIVANDDHCIALDDDEHVTEDTFRVTKHILEELAHGHKRDQKLVLVDVTGGVKAMAIGALLACLRPGQHAHLVGTKYNDQGDFQPDLCFPMVIEFEPV